MKRPQKSKVGGYIPRSWLLKAMHKWAKEVQKVKREKDIEIKILKETIKRLKEK